MKPFHLWLAFAPLLISAAEPATLDITVSGIRNTSGQLLTCLWKEKPGFPTCQKSATAVRQSGPVTGNTMRVQFNSIAPGTYAVTVHHDEDGNGKLKTNFIGMPKEGVGISNNPRGIPGWGKSLFPVRSGTSIAINMRYL